MFEIHLLGPTRVRRAGRELTARDLGGSKPRQLLAMLALGPGTPLAKETLAERLWEGQPPRSAIATLESYVCVLRRRLAELGGGSGVLRTAHGGYLLDPDRVRVDAVNARVRLTSSRLRVLRGTLDLVPSQLLADEPYAAWACEERDRLTAVCTQAWAHAAATANASGRGGLAVAFARAAIAADAWSEPAVRELMRGLSSVGERGQALRAYHALRTTMTAELGVEPSPATQQVYLALLRDSGDGLGDVRLLLDLLRCALLADATALRRDRQAVEVGLLLLDQGVA